MALALPFLLLITAKDNWHRGVKILLAIIAFGVCYSRVLLGAHYVSDVLAGGASQFRRQSLGRGPAWIDDFFIGAMK